MLSPRKRTWYTSAMKHGTRSAGLIPAAALAAAVVALLSACGSTIPDLEAHLAEQVPGLIDRYDIPGVAVAVIDGGEIAWTRAWGSADLERGRPMTTDAVCRAESISKSVTAWGVMTLVERGLIDLDAPVTRYLQSVEIPSGAFAAQEVTVRRVLSNSAGLPLGTVGPEIEYAPGADMPSAATYLADEVRLVQEPGVGFSYSNVGFNLLEVLIEDVTGADFEAYMDAAVLRPLGMSDASYASQAGMAGRIPIGYELDGTPVSPYVYPVSGAGGLVADVGALARFVAAGMSPAGTVLSAESIDLMHRPVVEVSGLFGLVADGYGLGHFTETLSDGRHAVWHGGQGHGWMTHFHAIPATGDGIVILTNSQRSWPFMAQLLSDWARWSGAARVKFVRIVWAGRALRAAVVMLALAVLAGAYRVARELLRGERRFTPRGLVGRRPAGAAVTGLRVRAAAGAAILAGLLWAILQPYLFVSWIFPVMTPWAGVALLGCGLVLIAAAVLPRCSRSVREDTGGEAQGPE